MLHARTSAMLEEDCAGSNPCWNCFVAIVTVYKETVACSVYHINLLRGL
jgi:hypothetical protein